MKKTISLLAVVLWLGAQVLFAQGVEGGHIGFSLSGLGELNGKEFSNGELLCYGEGGETRLLYSEEGLAFMVGDVDGDGVQDLLDNIDALHVAGVSSPTAFYFSTSKDVAGVKDGDLFRFQETGGFDVYLTEAEFMTITGASDGNVDIDAFTFTPSGDLYFSFAENEESTLISGSQPGIIEDGDIIFKNPQGLVKVLYTESDVSQMLSNAAGSSLKAGDVLGLSWDSVQSCLFFTVQSPSAYDATLLSTVGGGSLVPGYDETSLGFDNAVEIDAVSVLPVISDMPALEIDPKRPAQGDDIWIQVSKGKTDDVFYLFISSAVAGSVQPPHLGGFGLFLLEQNDPYFLLGVQQLPALMGVYNLGGVGEYGFTMPLNPTVVDIHIQAGDPNAWVFSHPVTLEFNQ